MLALISQDWFSLCAEHKQLIVSIKTRLALVNAHKNRCVNILTGACLAILSKQDVFGAIPGIVCLLCVYMRGLVRGSDMPPPVLSLRLLIGRKVESARQLLPLALPRPPRLDWRLFPVGRVSGSCYWWCCLTLWRNETGSSRFSVSEVFMELTQHVTHVNQESLFLGCATFLGFNM